MKRVAINGFGRIGRAFFCAANNDSELEVVAINDLMDTEMMAYLLQYDSVYGRFPGGVDYTGDVLIVGGREIPSLSVRNPIDLPWGEYDVDVVLESTGIFASYKKAQAHRDAGAKKVVISAPVKDDPPDTVTGTTVLVGVNTDQALNCDITSNASCTTNAIGIPIHALNEQIGIESAVLNTVHGYTATQQLVDGESSKRSNKRYGRGAAINIIPSSTGAAIATTSVVKDLSGKFDGIALRVPVAAGSVADVTFVAKRSTTPDEVNEVLKKIKHPLFRATNEDIVSSDIIGEPYVAIADLSMTRVVNNTLVKTLFWYDNERGYAQSLVEHIKNM